MVWEILHTSANFSIGVSDRSTPKQQSDNRNPYKQLQPWSQRTMPSLDEEVSLMHCTDAS